MDKQCKMDTRELAHKVMWILKVPLHKEMVSLLYLHSATTQEGNSHVGGRLKWLNLQAPYMLEYSIDFDLKIVFYVENKAICPFS